MDDIMKRYNDLKRDITIIKRCITRLQANERISVGPKSLYSTILSNHPSYEVLHTLMLETLKEDLTHLTNEYKIVTKTIRLRSDSI